MARVEEIFAALEGKVPGVGSTFIEVNQELGFSISVSAEGAIINYKGQQVLLNSDEINDRVIARAAFENFDQKKQ